MREWVQRAFNHAALEDRGCSYPEILVIYGCEALGGSFHSGLMAQLAAWLGDNGETVMMTLATHFRMEGREEGRAEGLREGEACSNVHARFRVAKAMLLDRMSGDLISKYTGVSEEQLEVLAWYVSTKHESC